LPVPLDAAIREAQAEVDLPLRQRGGEIAVEGPFPRVRAHRSTLVQVLTNLLTNAIVYVAPGAPPRIRVWTEERSGTVRVWVEDQGIGIAPEHQERIFHVFERLHGSETYPGTGIGLAIVRKGIERMGGTVGVESAQGAGSRFWIELPEESHG
jgi:signal transduction histidine kinase